MYLRDDTPADLNEYAASMFLRFDLLSMASGKSLPVFRALSPAGSSAPVFELRLVQGKSLAPRLQLAKDTSSEPGGLSREVCLATPGFHAVEIRWRSPGGPAPGLLALYVDRKPRATVASDQLVELTVDTVRLVSLRTTVQPPDTGVFDVDDFSSSSKLPGDPAPIFVHDFECDSIAGWSTTAP